MKYIRLIGFTILLFGYGTLHACDFCNVYLGINPNYNQNMLGLRYRTSSYKGNHSHDNHGHSHGGASNNSEYYNNYSLWGRWYPNPKLQLTGTLPFSDNYEMENEEKSEQITGFGDVSLIAQYQVYNTRPDSNSSFRQRLFLGGGIKLPTGKYQESNSDGGLSPLLQPGKGSFDFIISMSYLAKLNKFGLSTDLTYRITTPNKNDFRFSNRFNATALFFYQFETKPITIMPSAGVYFEQAGMDLDDATYLQNTGGEVLFSQVGMDLYYETFSLNFGYQIPLHENLFGEQGENKNRIIMGLNYAFN